MAKYRHWILVALCAGLVPIGACEVANLQPDEEEVVLEILPREATLTAIGDTAQLEAVLLTGTGERITPDSGERVEWISSNPEIVRIHSKGYIEALRIGRAIIRGWLRGRMDSVVVVITQRPDRVVVSPDSAMLTAIGDTARFTAVVLDRKGVPIDDATATWQSSDTSIAVVNDEGRVTARAEGSVEIVASAKGAAPDTARVDIVLPPGTDPGGDDDGKDEGGKAVLEILPRETTLTAIGDTVRLEAAFVTEDGKRVKPDASERVEWTSSNTGVARVRSSGTVEARGNGRAVIRGTVRGQRDSVTIVVSQKADRVVLSPDSLMVPVGEKRQVSARAVDANGSPTATPKLTWTSLNPEIASVDSMGTVTARAAGIALITISAVCCSADTTKVVAVPSAKILQVTPSTSKLTAIGATVQLSAQVLDASGASVPDVTLSWRSTNPTVAEVSASGVVTARGPGSSAIIVEADGVAPDTTMIQVEQVPARITVAQEAIRLNVGQTHRMDVEVQDANGATIVDPELVWTSLRSEVASVNRSGVVTARAVGTALITIAAVGTSVADTAEVIVGDVKPLFSDDFESYTVGSGIGGRGANGFSWGNSRYVTVSNDRSHSGTRSLKFRYGPWEPNGDSHMWAEQRFSHPQVKEYWIEFYWYVPANYHHVPGNNKFFSWWGPNRDNSVIPPSGTFQTWERYSAPNTGGHSVMRVNTWGPNGEHYPRVPGNQNRLFLTESHRGQWHRIRIYVRISDVGRSNGIARLWRGNDLIVDVVGDDNNNTNPAVNLMQHGYLMGYDNGRYRENTDFYIDDFKMFTSNPGW